MKARVFTSVLVGLCLASFARGENTISSYDVRYRISGVNDSYQAVPEQEKDSKARVRLGRTESLARCDALVAALLEKAAADAVAEGRRPATEPRLPEFVRDRTVELRRSRAWIDYAQRHQGYAILGAGARLILDDQGQIESGGLQLETESLPTFDAKEPSALAAIAERSVPHEITGPAVHSQIVIDPMGDAPARLVYFATYPIRVQERPSGWTVSVDAVTGQVIASESASKFVDDRFPQPIVIDDPPGGGGGGGDPPPTLYVYVDVGDCLSLEVQFADCGGGVTTQIVGPGSYSFCAVVGQTMTFRDRSLASTCTSSFYVNGSQRSLPFTYSPADFDNLRFDSDCRPKVRAPEGSGSICFSRSFSTNRIYVSDLTYDTVLHEWPIMRVSQESDPNNYLQVPCEVVQTPPGDVTIKDLSRFDEVNAFYQIRRFVDQYLEATFSVPLSWWFNVYTKKTETISEYGSHYDPVWDRLYLGEGDAYDWGAYGGKHYYDAAKFSSVMHHETVHGLIDQMYGYAAPSPEPDAVEEGICDYLAASFAGNPAIGLCFVKDNDHLRTCSNLAANFRYSIRSTVQYPVGSGFLAEAGSKYAQGMIVSGLLWDIRSTLGSIGADWILRDALQRRSSRPNFAQFGAAILAAAQTLGFECSVRPLLVAREFPGITPGSAATPTGLTVSTQLANRCQIHATWSGTGTSYRVTWTTDGGAEQEKGTVTSPVYDGNIGTNLGGTLKVYANFCGQQSGPASVRRETVTTTAASTAIRTRNQTNAQGQIETVIDWDPVANAPNYRVMRNGSQMGDLIPANQYSVIDPPGCGGTNNYCVEVVDCAGSHNVGPCQSIDRPGAPLAATISGPSSLVAGTSGTFTANITGGCGLANVTWYWLTECDSPKQGAALIEQCDRWYALGTNPLQLTIQKGWSHGNYGDLKVVVRDLNGVTVTSPIKVISITYPAPNAIANDDASRSTAGEVAEPPMRLSWDGESIALENAPASLWGMARLELFDVAGRRRALLAAAISGSRRLEFAVSADLARGVYFARLELPGGRSLKRTVVLR